MVSTCDPLMNTIDHPERRNLLQIAAKGFYLSLASWRYVRRTFTLPRVLVIGLTFCCLYFLYESAAGASHPLRWREALSGLTTFFLMFLQLRLVDDIADVDVDYPSQTCLKNLRRVRRSLWSGLFLVAGIVVLLNRDWIALAVALLALVFMLATYLGFKTTTSRLAVLGGSRTLPRILLSVA
jgi:4-hydroxybenzoate polyprenyltransferase